MHTLRSPVPLVPLVSLALLVPLATGVRAQVDARQLYTFVSDAPGERFGVALAAAGDADGDGHDDLAVGAPRANGAGASAGRVVLYHGRDGTVLWSLDGAAEPGRFGEALAPAGDVDGDGSPDLVVGAPSGGPSGAGAAYVVRARDGSTVLAIAGAAAGDRFGHSVAGVGDVDLDGFPDIAVGAPNHDGIATSSGRVRVVSGRDGTTLATYEGSSAVELCGLAVAGPGDVDLDGRPDVLVGIPLADDAAFNAGAAQILSGAGGVPLLRVTGTGIGDQLGTAVAGLGDLDGDGHADFAAGAPGSDAAALDAGRVTAYAGGSGTALLAFDGPSTGDSFFAVAGVGDADGDGTPDLVVGSSSVDAPGTDAGLAELRSGANGALLVAYAGNAAQAWLGASVAGAGDLNADGTPDFALGAPGNEDDQAALGTVRALSGRELALVVAPHLLSSSAGGVQQLALRAPAAQASGPYLVLGSRGGTSPGLVADGVPVPLNFEPVYFLYTLTSPNAPPLGASWGVLDTAGAAAATFTLPAGAAPSAIGSTIHHAFVALKPSGAVAFASGAVPLAIVP